jgi:mono/diheme cytochrome c family protein
MKRIYILYLIISLALLGLFWEQGVGNAAGEGSTTPTFTKDVAPVLYKNCVACHRPGQIAPMSFLSYKEVRPWAKSIREVTLERRMPPWFADPHYGEFINDRRLSQKEIDTLVAWVDSGAKQGDPKDLPPVPQFPDQTWSIGQPDAVLSMTEEASVPAEGVVPYRFYVVPTNFTEDKYVQAAEIRRGTPSVVHHVIINVWEPGRGPLPPAGELRSERFDRPRALDDESEEGSGESARNRNPDGMLIGWAPGMSPLVLRPGLAKLIKKGSVLVFQMHYTTNGEPAKDRTGVGLIFAKSPVEKRLITAGAATRNLVIPPGEPNHESHSSFAFKEDSHILGFMPHMHYRGKDFEYRLVYPDGTSKILLRVPNYNFNWQLNYWLKKPVAAPKGSRLECTAHHDNSAKNKYNPDPTKEVRWGQQTWEEMMIGWLDYTLDAQDLRPVTTARDRNN